ncbi:MAG: Carbonic anhydrase (EC [uncultured Thiotrichaceae bacterium]|uniref:carbonic anhydrase n=1 Tax=uncultured Thiotrichaceae bacterium TaxID=298394 RepID=A0A6S6UHN3_9GAMM|nr:MAG: Carbonic anhydrase (EC [uncultured Thiotrichaceae bacterium]
MKYRIFTPAIALSVLFASTHLTAKDWSYEGNTGPAQWGALSEENVACHSGKNQSPVNIETAKAVNANLQPIKFNYGMLMPHEITNTGKAIRVKLGMGSDILADDQEFELKFFEFHTPSQTMVNGKAFPMEALFHHETKDGEVAIVSMMFVPGEADHTINKLWEQLPMEAGKSERLSAKALRPIEMTQKLDSYYRYNGSLTTPPCTEGVRWFVLKQPMKVSAAQLTKIKKALKTPNSRPVQALHARQIFE